MIKEHKRLSNEASEKTNRTGNAYTATLEVAEAAELEGFELGV